MSFQEFKTYCSNDYITYTQYAPAMNTVHVSFLRTHPHTALPQIITVNAIYSAAQHIIDNIHLYQDCQVDAR